MKKLEYAPKALDDLQNIKDRITELYGLDVAKKCMKKITTTARQLEQFPEEGVELRKLLDINTDYWYLVAPQPQIRNTSGRIMLISN